MARLFAVVGMTTAVWRTVDCLSTAPINHLASKRKHVCNELVIGVGMRDEGSLHTLYPSRIES